MNLDKLYKILNEAEGNGKYFYIVGEANATDYYYDSDTHMNIPEPKTMDQGYIDKIRYNTLEEVIDAVIKDGYDSIEEKENFPKDFDYLEEIRNEDEAKLTPQEYPNYYELLSFFVEKEEEFGPEYHEVTEIVSRLIQICKEK